MTLDTIDEYIRTRRALGLLAEKAVGASAQHAFLASLDFAALIRCRDLVDQARAEGYAKGFEAGQQSKVGEHG